MPESSRILAKGGKFTRQPKPSQAVQRQDHLFQARLDQQLNLQHPLVQLAQQIEWEFFEREYGALYVSDVGRPGIPTRVLVGLHYLKHAYGESDESVVARWVENPYWQYFCGYEFLQHEVPCHPTALVKWRQRLESDGIEKMLQALLATALRTGALDQRDLAQVNVDPTVQEKAIAFPTDARLYHKARVALVREAKKAGVKLRQSYARARQGKRADKEKKKLHNYLGRVLRDIERKLIEPPDAFKELLKRARRIYEQKKDDQHKLYSMHAPEVECIAKGKAHKKCEFGCKVAVARMSKSNWVVAAPARARQPLRRSHAPGDD